MIYLYVFLGRLNIVWVQVYIVVVLFTNKIQGFFWFTSQYSLELWELNKFIKNFKVFWFRFVQAQSSQYDGRYSINSFIASCTYKLPFFILFTGTLFKTICHCFDQNIKKQVSTVKQTELKLDFISYFPFMKSIEDKGDLGWIIPLSGFEPILYPGQFRYILYRKRLFFIKVVEHLHNSQSSFFIIDFFMMFDNFSKEHLTNSHHTPPTCVRYI